MSKKKFFWTSVIVLILTFLTIKAGVFVPMVSLILRLGIPVGAAYLAYKFFENKLLGPKRPQQLDKNAIDLEYCSKCQTYKTPSHDCL